MLIQKKVTAGSIITVKLMTGDELVTKLVASDDGKSTITISKPIAVGMAQDGSVAFMPFILGAPAEIEMTFEMSKVLTYFEARKEIKDAYIQNTSGITPASAGSLGEGLIGAHR